MLTEPLVSSVPRATETADVGASTALPQVGGQTVRFPVSA